MSAVDVSKKAQFLSTLLAQSLSEESEIELSSLFDNCLQLRESIEKCSLSSSDKEYQEAVVIGIQALEQCTRMVNELSLFSSNEAVEELQTESIRYLLLPALLGSLSISIQSKDLSERMENVQKSEIYFNDFLFRCKNYEFPVSSLHHISYDSDEENNEKKYDPQTLRERKLQQFRKKKELEEREKVLQYAKDSQREYQLILIEKWILIAVEELDNIKKEKEILEFMPRKDNSAASTERRPKSDVKPLRPIIITKNEVQKRVFGIGYPSLPIFTIEDFFQQRFEKQVQNHMNQPRGKSLQDRAIQGTNDKEMEELQKEEEIERDDPDALAKARNWDEWKDENPRGSGNRHNKG